MGRRVVIFLIAVQVLAGFNLGISGPASIAIQPFNGTSVDDIKAVESGISDYYNVNIEILPEKPLPTSAYYAPRNRHRAEALLEYLQGVSTHTRIVGLAAGDISTSKGMVRDWGIFGLGTIGGRTCVLSGFRLQREKVGRERYLERLRRVANHELGHTFGLRHCTTSGCLMQDMGGKVATVDASDGRLCERCAAKLKARSLLREPVVSYHRDRAIR